MTGIGTEGMYLRDLSQDYNAEYFIDNALVAVSFEYSSSSIPKFIYRAVRTDSLLTAWTYSFEDMSLPENEKFTSGLYAARVFLLEVKKADVEGVTEVHPGINGAPVIILPDPTPVNAPLFIDGGRGFLVAVHEDWTDKYTVEHQENGFTVYHKATYNVNSDIGMLFRVSRREGVIPDEWITENSGGATYFSGDDYYIAFIVPTDMQYIPGDSTGDEYLGLAAKIPEIRRGISVSMKDAAVNAKSAEPQPARPAELEEAVYGFIPWHHNYYIFMNNDELKPEVNTLYAIWRTYLLETAIGGTFEADEKNFGWKIPAEAVKNAVSYLYNLDGYSVQYDDFYINKDNPDYFWLPDAFSPDTVWAFIQWDTLTVNDSVCTFDVIFYASPHGTNSYMGEELRTFRYKFEHVLYKDSSPSKTVCYKFIGATRVK